MIAKHMQKKTGQHVWLKKAAVNCLQVRCLCRRAARVRRIPGGKIVPQNVAVCSVAREKEAAAAFYVQAASARDICLMFVNDPLAFGVAQDRVDGISASSQTASTAIYTKRVQVQLWGARDFHAS